MNSKLAFSFIVLVLVIGTLTAGDIPDGLDDSSLDSLNEQIPTEFTYCEYSNLGNSEIQIKEMVVSGKGSGIEWFPSDNVGVKVEISNKGDNKLTNLEFEYCINDGTRCIMSGKNSVSFNLEIGETKSLIFGLNVNPIIFTQEKEYTLHIKATGEKEIPVEIKLEETNAFSFIDELEITTPAIPQNEKTCISTSEFIQIKMPEPVYVEWDVNGDDLVTVDDAHFLINYLFIDGYPAPDPLLRADFNNNGEISIGDISLLINHLIELGILIPDKTAPVIILVSPTDNKEFETNDDKDIKFIFKVSDDSEIDYCKLVINGKDEKTIDNPTKDKNIEVVINLDIDDYTWKVICVDVYGNSQTSETRSFEIDEETPNRNNNDNGYYSQTSFRTPAPKNLTNVNNLLNESSQTINLETKDNTSKFDSSKVLPILLIAFILIILIVIALVLKNRMN